MSWKFLTAAKANAEIDRLRQLLGQPKGERIFHMARANAEVERLEKELAGTGSAGARTSKPAAPAPAVSLAAQTRDPDDVPERKISRWHLAELLRQDVFNGTCALPDYHGSCKLTDAVILARIEEAAFKGHCRMPFMDSDEKLATKYRRMPLTTAMGSYLRGLRQNRIDDILRLDKPAAYQGAEGMDRIASACRADVEKATGRKLDR